MPNDIDSVEADIEIINLPDLACFKTFGDLLRALPEYLQVRIPKSITNVIVGSVQPLETQRDFVWFRMSTGGVFIGIYLFSDGTWRQFFPVVDGIYKVFGDSREPPDGYILATDSGKLTAAQKSHLEATWLFDPTNTFYVLFDVVVAPT